MTPLDRFGKRHWETLRGRHRLSSLERHRQADAELSPDRHQQDSHHRHWQKRQVRASSDRTPIKPIRQTLARDRHWADPERHQVTPLDRFGKRHWETLRGRHRLSSLERHWQADAELSPGRHQQDSHNKTLAERHS